MNIMSHFTHQKLLLFTLLLLSFSTTFAQVTAVSPDKSFFAVSYYVPGENNTFKEGLNVYTLNGRHIKYFELNDFDCERISGLYFVNNNKNIFLKSKCNYMGSAFEQYSLWEVETRNKVAAFKAASANQIAFSSKADFFVIRLETEDYIEMYDTKKGKQMGFFDFEEGTLGKVDKITISQDDRLVSVKKGSTYIVLNRDKKSEKNMLEGVHLLFINSGREVQLFKADGSIERLETEKYKSKGKLNAPAYQTNFAQAIVNSKGNFTALVGNNSVLVIDNQTYTNYFELNDIGNIQHIEFEDDNTLIIDEDENGRIVDLKSKKVNTVLNYKFIPKPNEPKIELGEQLNLRILSPDRSYTGINYTFNNANIVFFKKNDSDNYITIPDYTLVSFSADSKYAFLKNKKEEVGLVKVEDLANYAKKINFSPLVNPALMDNEEYARYNSSEDDKEKRKELIAKNEMKAEDFVTADNPPKDFRFNKASNYKPISEADPKTLQITLRNVVADPRATQINVHLMDDKGNYYFGAGKDKTIWNKLTIKYPDGTTKELKDYEVIEHTANDTTPCAVVLILDQSGSMGDARARMLQDGAENVIRKKRPQDAMAIIKYDSWVGTEAKLNTSADELLSLLQKNGLEGYGAQTAIYDAIDEGRFLLRNVANRYNKRTIIILTDGNENASKLTKNQVIANVIKRGINVYTIGFGRKVSSPDLQSIAYSTGGGFYHIYTSDDLKWIYEDVYNKSLSYYTIKFKNDKVGKHVAKIDIHYKGKFQDDLIVAYDNSERKLEEIDEKSDDAFGVPLVEVPSIDDKKKKFASKELMDEQSDIINSTKSNLDVVINHEFKAIDFPDVQFVTNTAKIVAGTEKGIEEVIDFMQIYPESEIEIEGHTDNAGTPEFNMKLSEKRAFSIKELVKAAGISETRIKVTGYGETQPLAPNDTEEGKAKNRRVVFKLLKL